MTKAITLTSEAHFQSFVKSVPYAAIYIYDGGAHDLPVFNNAADQLTIPGQYAFAFIDYPSIADIIEDLVDMVDDEPMVPALLIYRAGEPVTSIDEVEGGGIRKLTEEWHQKALTAQ
ncbi:hypothetical protein PT974_04857 [Cladobotryum mycophilum]|uniref:Uncharacterized protein n=1 Tax=Cladobotryum mycophilum TaxID=491253 RepID=A0ABR0SQK2_9HYPO